MDPTVATYLNQQSSAYRIDARSKILVLAVYSVSIFFIDSWAGLGAFAILFFLMLATFKPPIKRVFTIAAPIYVLVAITIVFNIFTPLPDIPAPSLEGLYRGCFFATRILLLLWASMVVCLSVPYTEITRAFSRLLSPLRALKVPVDALATVFSIALRFIPLTVEEFFAIKDAQWTRCATFDEGSLIKRIRAYAAILIPLFIALFKRADRLAYAMDLRCYGIPSQERTSVYENRMNALSYAALVLFTLAPIAAAILL